MKSLWTNKRSISIITQALLTFILIHSCSNTEIASQRVNSNISIDGNSGDWSEYNQHYNEDWKTVYSVINNDTSISLMVQFRDHQLARKINTRGFTLWLNTEGEEEKIWGIHYENRELMNKMLNEMADSKSMPKRENRNSEMNKTEELSGTFALVDKDKNLLSENGQSGIYAEAMYDKGSYCFEYKIMFDTNENNPDLFAISPETDLKIGIEIAAVSEEFKEIMQQKMADKMKNGQRPSGGMSGGGRSVGGMRRGGMRGGGKGGPSVGNRDNMMNDLDGQEIWTTVVLAN